MQEYEPVIGLEIHAQLKTKSKMFCASDNYSVNVEPNTNVCPVCMGFPGTLPVPNLQAIEWTMLLGMALDAKIAEEFNFERKNYFYPDLPKAYQISSATNPPVIGGSLKIDTGKDSGPSFAQGFGTGGQARMTAEGTEREIRLHHIHLEEDAGKLVHAKNGTSLVDLNRAGTPLVEIVTEPDLRSGVEARVFMQTLRSLLRHLQISDANMEQGNLRCDVNISLRKVGEKKLGAKVEIKNMNSFKMIERAVNYEIERQTDLLKSGKKIAQETRGWDDAKGRTLGQRSKEEAHDYRYFPEPDIPKVSTKVDSRRSLSARSRWIPAGVYPPEALRRRAGMTKEGGNDIGGIDLEKLRSLMPELPWEKKTRFEAEYGLNKKDADYLADDVEMADYFEKTLGHIEEASVNSEIMKKYATRLSNWMTSELAGKMNEASAEIDEIKIEPENMAELMISIEKGAISGKQAKDVFAEMFETGKSAYGIIEEKGMKQITDTGALESVIDEVLAANPKVVEDYKSGKEKAFGFLIGQVMAKTKGQANPKAVNEVLKRKLK